MQYIKVPMLGKRYLKYKRRPEVEHVHKEGGVAISNKVLIMGKPKLDISALQAIVKLSSDIYG